MRTNIADGVVSPGAGLQGSLLDLDREPAFAPLPGTVTRTNLGLGAWVEVRPAWLRGADDVFEELRTCVPWQAERRAMYNRVVDVPRLTRFYGEHEPLPHNVLTQARDLLSEHYALELGEPFVTAGLCLYRDGNDSVAWHGDRIGRSREHDTRTRSSVWGQPVR